MSRCYLVEFILSLKLILISNYKFFPIQLIFSMNVMKDDNFTLNSLLSGVQLSIIDFASIITYNLKVESEFFTSTIVS